MEDEVYKELQYIPARFKVLEHHIKVYAGNSDCGGFLRAKARNVCWRIAFLPRSWQLLCLMQSM